MTATLRIAIIVWLSMPLLSLAACDGSPHPDQAPTNSGAGERAIEASVVAPVSVTDLTLAFRRQYPPDIVYALNEVKKSSVQFEVIELVSCAYQLCEQMSTEWDRSALSNDLVRVNLLDVLVQARGQGIDFTTGLTVREDTIELLANRNPFVVQRALMVLSYIDDDADVANIEDVALSTSDDVTFRYAILALKLMSAPGSQDATHRILASVDDRRAELVMDLVDQ